MSATPADRYLVPGSATKLFNTLVGGLTKLGVSVWGSRILSVQGRKSGQWRSTPVNVLTIDGQRYLVSPRGTTQWVRNLRVSGVARLQVGRRVETVSVAEMADVDKPAVLRAYLRRWKFEVGAFFDGLDAKSTDEQFQAAGPKHPIFVIGPASS